MKNKLTSCTACGSEIAKNVRCPKCGKDNRSFFRKHKILSGFLVFIFLGVLIAALGGDDASEAGDVARNSDNTTENTSVEKEPIVEAPIKAAPEAPPTTTEEIDNATMGEKNAAKSALNYLRFSPFSYSGLVEQLEFEGYSNEEAVYGVDECGADWNEQAALKATDYLAFTAFSYSGLIQQLEFEGFTKDEAVYGVDECGADWNEQAAIKAQEYLDFSSFSRAELISQLEFEGFSRQEAEYGVEAVGY